MANIELLFPTVLYVDKIDLTDDLIESLKSESLKRTGKNNGWFTDTNLQKKRKYRRLISQIDNHVEIYCKDVMKMRRDIKFSCCGAWANVHDPGDWAHDHYHPNSFISGVLYLDIPVGSGPITFSENSYRTNNFGPFFFMDYEEFNPLNASNVEFMPERGTIYLFPSTLVHSVSQNATNQRRYSFAFDYMPTGKLKTANNEITISV